MEKIKQRSMVTYVLSIGINLALAIGVGLLVGIVLVIGGGEALSILFLPLIFLGISLSFVNFYQTYFYYRLSLDVDAVCMGDGKETDSYLFNCVLSFMTFGIYNLYWTYKLGQRIKVNSPRYGFKVAEGGKDLMILNLFSWGYVSTWELIKNMNKIAKVYNAEGLAKVGGEY